MSLITRVAGIPSVGHAGYSGDDGPATEARLNVPSGVAVTADGGFLIADSANYVVRKVSPAGVITRVAGTGTDGYSGDDGPATEAQLGEPAAVPKSAQPWVSTLVRTIFEQPDAASVRARHAQVVAALEAKFDAAAEHLDDARDDDLCMITSMATSETPISSRLPRACSVVLYTLTA